jgi:hypothetical protein
MRTVFLLSALFALVLAPASRTAWGNGLLYRLPEDGARARFDMKMEYTDLADGEAKQGDGSMTVSSVGSCEVEGQECRWIELKGKMETEGSRDFVCKALLPEKYLKEGEKPLDHLVRAWGKMGRGEAEEIKDPKSPRAGPLAAFLCGPLKDTKKLKKKVVKTKLGEFECEGVRGNLSIEQGSETIQVEYRIRLHDKAPFGVVAMRMNIDVRRNGEARSKGELNLKLVEIGKGAKSALPDKN